MLCFLVLQVDAPAHRPHQCLRGDLPVDEGGSSPGPRQGAHQVRPAGTNLMSKKFIPPGRIFQYFE